MNMNVFMSMQNVTLSDARDDIVFCLENYRTLIYNGNLDIIVNTPGVLDMINDLTNWSGYDKYKCVEIM